MNAVEDVWRRLREIVDPELGCNIVDLGLVRSMTLAGSGVRIEMTLTSPSCPLGGILVAAVESVLLEVPGIEKVKVNLVFTPPWSLDEMSDAARAQLGVPAGAPVA